MTVTPVSTTANLFYGIKPEGGVQACQHITVDPFIGERPNNIKHEQKSVVIENIRGKEDSVSLDTTGFQFYKHASKHTAFDNDEEIRREYYPESLELIKKLTGASRVELFEHIVRRRLPGQLDVPDSRQPIARIHVDQTPASAITLLRKHLPPSDVPKLLERRFQIINLWRPIAHPAVDCPLALCDYRTVDLTKDTFTMTRIPAKGEVLELIKIQYNENHKWKYLHGMTPEEFILFKSADTIQDGSVAVFTPHTAFDDPTTPEGTPPRQSIELRALVFYD